MPFKFTGYKGAAYSAKPGVVSDGETFTVSEADGYTLTSTLSTYSAFVSNPVRGGVGVFSLTLKDSTVMLLDFEVETLTTDGYYLSCQKNLPTVDSLGRTVLHFTFHNAGTPANFQTGQGDQKFIVHVKYTETRI